MNDFRNATANLSIMLDATKLATRIPILTVANTLILPRGTVPLLLEDDRDIRVFNRALRMRKLIGIVQEKPSFTPHDEDAFDYPQVLAFPRKRIDTFETGCLASIQGFQETPTGVLVIAQGICRFRMTTSVLSQHRLAYDVTYDEFTVDTASIDEHHPSRTSLLTMISNNPDLYEDNPEVLQDLFQSSSNKIITAVAMTANFTPGEKQALLESKTVDERCSLVSTLFEVNQPGVAITRH